MLSSIQSGIGPIPTGKIPDVDDKPIEDLLLSYSYTRRRYTTLTGTCRQLDVITQLTMLSLILPCYPRRPVGKCKTSCSRDQSVATTTIALRSKFMGKNTTNIADILQRGQPACRHNNTPYLPGSVDSERQWNSLA